MSPGHSHSMPAVPSSMVQFITFSFSKLGGLASIGMHFGCFGDSETSDISHLQDFQPSSNSSVCGVMTFDALEIPVKILGLL